MLFITDRFNDLSANRSIAVSDDAYQATKLFKGLNAEDMRDVFADGYLYYYHNFGIQTKFFQRNQDAMKNFYLVGTSSKVGLVDSFVASIEHKVYPFMANQWHPEKNANEKGYKYRFLDHSRKTIRFLNSISRLMIDKLRETAKPLDSLPPVIESFLAWSFDPVQTNYTGNDRIYIVPRVLEDHEL